MKLRIPSPLGFTSPAGEKLIYLADLEEAYRRAGYSLPEGFDVSYTTPDNRTTIRHVDAMNYALMSCIELECADEGSLGDTADVVSIRSLSAVYSTPTEDDLQGSLHTQKIATDDDIRLIEQAMAEAASQSWGEDNPNAVLVMGLVNSLPAVLNRLRAAEARLHEIDASPVTLARVRRVAFDSMIMLVDSECQPVVDALATLKKVSDEDILSEIEKNYA